MIADVEQVSRLRGPSLAMRDAMDRKNVHIGSCKQCFFGPPYCEVGVDLINRHADATNAYLLAKGIEGPLVMRVDANGDFA